jgi:glutathione peroxidase
MFYKNYLLIITSLIMFSFLEKAEAKYEKLFFDLSIKGINDETINLSEFKGKTILLVNVASKCGFTKQYTGLQTLYDNYKKKKLLSYWCTF